MRFVLGGLNLRPADPRNDEIAQKCQQVCALYWGGAGARVDLEPAHSRPIPPACRLLPLDINDLWLI